MTSDDHQDWQQNPVKVGDTVKFGVEVDAICKVISISDPDGDVDDDTGKGILIPPRLTVRYEDGETDWCDGYNVAPMSPDPFFIWQFDDIEVIRDEDTAPHHSAMGDRP